MALGMKDYKVEWHNKRMKEESYNAKKKREYHEANLMKSSSGTVCEATQARIAEGRESNSSKSKASREARRDYDSYASNNMGEAV